MDLSNIWIPVSHLCSHLHNPPGQPQIRILSVQDTLKLRGLQKTLSNKHDLICQLRS